MTRIRAYKLVSAALLAATSLISVAKADLSPLSRTSDYALDWSDSTFDNADALYVTSYAYGAQTPTTQTFNQSFSSNAAEPFFFDTGGGISISGISGTPGPGAVVGIDLASNGSAGFWDVSYNEPAIPSGGVLTPGTSGGLATLNFTGGGFVNGTNGTNDGVPSQFFIFVHLAGNWTTMGTSTGDVEFNSVGPGFSTPTFTFNAANDTTTVESINDDYQSGGVTNLDFTLFGAEVAAVPEPSTWAMMLLGFGILGFASYYKKSLVSA
jgi:hypothetical protein